MEDIIIIGAGLSGLVSAYQLKKKQVKFRIIEAQNRVGGRIETVYGRQNTPMEMGATWFGDEHRNLLDLLDELHIGPFEQHTEGIALFETMSFTPPQQYLVPANAQAAYRMQGGSTTLIHALLAHVGMENILLDTSIVHISQENDHLCLTDATNQSYRAKQVIIAMPPKLIAHAMQFSPLLPAALTQVMQQTQTWMSGSTKFAVEYARPFWKEHGFSGSVYSQSGLATEIYDHSNVEETKFALKGFLNGSAIHYTQAERKEKVIAQLVHYFGSAAQDCLAYTDKIWHDSFIQPPNDTFLPPHRNNGHPVYQESYWDKRLFFTGTETSKSFSGYMEGAIIAAKAVANAV